MSFADFTKWLIDAMHAHYQTSLKSELDFRAGDSHRASELHVPLATTLIEKVEFYDSIAVIHRAHGRREVADQCLSVAYKYKNAAPHRHLPSDSDGKSSEATLSTVT